jgi:hypothetical protein
LVAVAVDPREDVVVLLEHNKAHVDHKIGHCVETNGEYLKKRKVLNLCKGVKEH